MLSIVERGVLEHRRVYRAMRIWLTERNAGKTILHTSPDWIAIDDVLITCNKILHDQASCLVSLKIFHPLSEWGSARVGLHTTPLLEGRKRRFPGWDYFIFLGPIDPHVADHRRKT